MSHSQLQYNQTISHIPNKLSLLISYPNSFSNYSKNHKYQPNYKSILQLPIAIEVHTKSRSNNQYLNSTKLILNNVGQVSNRIVKITMMRMSQ